MPDPLRDELAKAIHRHARHFPELHDHTRGDSNQFRRVDILEPRTLENGLRYDGWKIRENRVVR